MSKIKYTPGPWSVPHFVDKEINCGCEYVFGYNQDFMGAVASVHYSAPEHSPEGDNPPIDVAAVNARLISQAPSFYEHCKALVAHVRQKHSVSDGTPLECEHLRAIEAAIAAVEGTA